jgi:hypothetical protein
VPNATRPTDSKPCHVCKVADIVELTRIDLIAGDPARWPRTLWKEHGWDAPKGLLPPHYRTWGQFAVARDLLNRQGYDDLTDNQIRTHLRHIPKMLRRPADLASVGLIAGDPITGAMPDPQSVDPNAYLTYYARGVKVGIRGLDLLEKRIDEIEKRGEQVPLDLIKMMVEAGSKLSTSQAQIRARGLKMHEDSDDDAFRRAASPEDDGEVPRFGEIRVRTIDGETRPVVDGGRGDRADYNERAEKEGLPGLPT